MQILLNKAFMEEKHVFFIWHVFFINWSVFHQQDQQSIEKLA